MTTSHNAVQPTGYELMKQSSSGVRSIVVCGIATNICCFFVARDLRAAGFEVLLVEDACAGLDVPAANLYQAAAKAEGQRLGIEYCTVADVARALTT
jgi:nicotinamidase/pyrazinamidase